MSQSTENLNSNNNQTQQPDGEAINNRINVTPLDITNQATMGSTLVNFEDVDDIMAIVNGPKPPRTHPDEYVANLNLHSNGNVTDQIYNSNLNTFGNNIMNSGFDYYVTDTGVTIYYRQPHYKERNFSVSRTGNLTIFNETNIQVRENQVSRGQNMERNGGPNTVYQNNYVIGNFEFDVTKTVPNVLALNQFLTVERCSLPSTEPPTSDRAYVLKISTLNSNIRTNTPFPHTNIPMPTDEEVHFVDFSSLAGKTLTADFWSHMNTVSPCRWVNDNNVAYKLYVDMSNTIEGEFSAAKQNGHPAYDITNNSTAPLIARILDDTLTRQDIRWGLFLIARPLSRYLSASDVSMSGNGQRSTTFALDVYLPKADNRDTYLKWLTKTNYDHNEYTISTMIEDHTFACNLVRDFRLCKTFLLQTAAYMAKISYIPDSNSLFTPPRYSQLLGFNLVNLGDIYSATFADQNHQFSNWIAWVPFELAKNTNDTVKFDEPKWRRSRLGKQIADKVKRPRSRVVPSDMIGSYYVYNILDESLTLEGHISSTRMLTIAALPVSLYWERTHASEYTMSFSEDDLLEDNFLQDYDYFPELSFETTWN